MGSLFGRLVFMRECKWCLFRFQACAPPTPTPRNSRRRELVVVRVVVVVVVVAVNAWCNNQHCPYAAFVDDR